MVDLMLQTSRQNSLGLDLLDPAFAVEIAGANPGWALDILINIRDREAAFLITRQFCRCPNDFWIGETKRLRRGVLLLALGDIENDHATLLGNLDGRKPDARSGIHGFQ